MSYLINLRLASIALLGMAGVFFTSAACLGFGGVSVGAVGVSVGTGGVGVGVTGGGVGVGGSAGVGGGIAGPGVSAGVTLAQMLEPQPDRTGQVRLSAVPEGARLRHKEQRSKWGSGPSSRIEAWRRHWATGRPR